MNEYIKMIVWQMAQILGYEGEADLAEHSLLLLVDYDANSFHPVFVGKELELTNLGGWLPWDEAVRILTCEVIAGEYVEEADNFFSAASARRKFEKQRVHDAINYISRLSNGKKWTHCIQSIFSSADSLQAIATAIRESSGFFQSARIIFPEFTSPGIQPEAPHLMSYFLVIEVDAIRKSMESLRYLARHDQLTGLYNRHMMAEITTDEPAIVIIIDIDNFKRINDAYGHAAGDDALRTLAGRLEAIFWRRYRDLVFRLGGDEFLVVMKEAGIEQAAECLDRLCEPITFTSSSNQVITFTVSAGYALCDGNFKETMKSADTALYRAKRNGRNGFSKAE